MDDTQPAERHDRASPIGLALCLLGVVILSLGGRDPDGTAAYQAGQVVGRTVATLVVGGVVWTLIWLASGRRKGRPWLSVWLGGTCLIVALVLALARIGQQADADALRVLTGS